MIIDEMTDAHKAEYYKNLLGLERLTLESVTEQRDTLAEALRKIARQDYRGNRPWSATVAHETLAAMKSEKYDARKHESHYP